MSSISLQGYHVSLCSAIYLYIPTTPILCFSDPVRWLLFLPAFWYCVEKSILRTFGLLSFFLPNSQLLSYLDYYNFGCFFSQLINLHDNFVIIVPAWELILELSLCTTLHDFLNKMNISEKIANYIEI